MQQSYELLIAYTRHDLKCLIAKYEADGWQLQGGVAMCVVTRGGRQMVQYGQAVIKMEAI